MTLFSISNKYLWPKIEFSTKSALIIRRIYHDIGKRRGESQSYLPNYHRKSPVAAPDQLHTSDKLPDDRRIALGYKIRRGVSDFSITLVIFALYLFYGNCRQHIMSSTQHTTQLYDKSICKKRVIMHLNFYLIFILLFHYTVLFFCLVLVIFNFSILGKILFRAFLTL